MDCIGPEVARSRKPRYMAMTDGVLQHRVGTRIQATVEIKKAIQHGIDKTTTKQEFKDNHLAPFSNQ